MPKLPFIKFFPRDWMGDEAVRICSVAARGLWIDMLCLMHSAPRRGYLQTATGSPLPLEQIARMAGCSTDEATRLLSELKTAGVYDCTEHGMIYSRRMVREADISVVRSTNGQKGAAVTNTVCRGKTAANGSATEPAKKRPSEAQNLRSSESVPSERAVYRPPVDEQPVEKKPKKDPDGPHHQAIRSFMASWHERYGEKYPFDSGKDGALVKWILGHCDGDTEKFAAAVRRYLACAEPIVVNARHPLSLMKSGLARYIVDAKVVPPKPDAKPKFDAAEARQVLRGQTGANQGFHRASF